MTAGRPELQPRSRRAGSGAWPHQAARRRVRVGGAEGVGAATEVGFHGATPTAQRVNANQVVATNLATAIAQANEIRVTLVEKEIIRGAG